MKEYYVTGLAKFQVEWEEKFTKLWSELTVKEQRSLIPIQPPYTEESVVEFLAKLRKIKESRKLSFPSLSKKKIPFPRSDVRYWKMVEIPGKNYSIGKYPVTQALWESVMGNNPSYFKGSSRPVEKVNWFECVAFCNKLSEIAGLGKVYTINGEEVAAGFGSTFKDSDRWYSVNVEDVECNFESDGYRLPTDWEWWFAAEANQKSWYTSDDSDHAVDVAWYDENSNDETHGVGQKKCNAFGLFDMIGNVYEWCWDWLNENPPEYDPPTEDLGPSIGLYRVVRGGNYSSYYPDLFSYHRQLNVPFIRSRRQGFRLSRTIR